MDDVEPRQSRNGIQVIERAARILRVLKQSPEDMSLGQIAEAVELPRSTVQRIIGALQDEEFVAAGENGRLVRLGRGLAALAERPRRSVIDLCRPFLASLSRETGETADLSALRGATMIFLDQIAGSHRLRAISSVGDVFPLTSTANGRAALAELPDDLAVELAAAEWQRRGLPSDRDGLAARLDRVRATGLAYDLDEHTVGISAIGFAFTDGANDVYAVSMPVPSSRFKDGKDKVEAALLRAKEAVSSATA